MPADFTSLTRRDTLGRVGDGPGSVISLWGYVTNDPIATVKGAGYFNTTPNAAPQVVGDVIDVVSSALGTPVYTVLKVIQIFPGGGVSVS
jgi:hypothetical protein